MTVPAPTTEQKRRWPRITRKQRDAFLDALGHGYSVQHAAEHADRHRRRFYALRDADEAFAAEWDDALEAGTHVLVDEARRRAVEGVEKNVYQRGELVGTVREYSDNLLMFLIKQRDPSFRENARLEVTGANGGPVELAADYRPTTLADVVRLVHELGLDDDVIDGEAVEVEPIELTEGGA